MPKKVCIMCHQELNSAATGAVRVKEDVVIRAIRSVKKVFRAAQNNELFVCQNDLEKHQEKRKRFEKEMLIISAIAVIIVILLSGLPALAGRFQLSVFMSSIFIAVLVILFAVVFRYAPAVEGTTGIAAKTTTVVRRVKNKKDKNKKAENGRI